MKKKDAIGIVRNLPTSLSELSDVQKDDIRSIVDQYKVEGVNLRGNCPNCWHDAVMVLRNFFGINASAAQQTDDAGDKGRRWKYVGKVTMMWRGHVIDNTTPDDIVDEFVKFHPKFYEPCR